MIDVVKFTWRNRHGYWIPVAWMITLSTDDAAMLRSRASLGRPSLTDFRVLSRETVPEEVRLTGRAQRDLSNVVLFDPREAEYDADEMIEAMIARAA